MRTLRLTTIVLWTLAGSTTGCSGTTANPLVEDAGVDAGASDAFVADDASPGLDGEAAGDLGTRGDLAVAPAQVGLLINNGKPMPCADPAVFSEGGKESTYYVYCTGMSHVWKTADWAHYTDERANTTFNLAGMSANGMAMGSWWAPGIVYAGAGNYVMWVSVPDAQATNGPGGWDTRSVAVFTSPTPLGTWTFGGVVLHAAAVGDHYIDPFLFIDHDGSHYAYWKQYGNTLSSSLMGAQVDAAWTGLMGSSVEIEKGYNSAGWELNVRENPAVFYDATTKQHHLIYSGAHWPTDTYATGHALSSCGPLCGGGWPIVSSGDRGIEQVIQANGDGNFSSGGPGGAVFQTSAAEYLIYAAAARSASGDASRYLMRDRIQWANSAPYVDNPGHRPTGL